MLRPMALGCIVAHLGLLCTGCIRVPQQSASDEYSSALPIWIVEDDPHLTVYARKDLERDRKVGKMLVIPLYRYFQHNGATEFLAIAHPFVYEQGEDIEKHLSSFEQRKNLRRLVFWVPDYFPDGLGRIPSWEPTINGKRMIVKELQACIGTERNEINSAMKKLLLQGDFTIGEMVYLTPPPPPYGPAKMSSDSYDASRVVRSVKYGGRYYNHQAVESNHVLWAFNPGTRITNCLSDEEKRIVTAFAAEVAKQRKEEPAKGEPVRSHKHGEKNG